MIRDRLGKRRCTTHRADGRLAAAVQRDRLLQGHDDRVGCQRANGHRGGRSELLPVGSVISVSTEDTKYNGVYTIMDTGPQVQGRLLDLYMWSCHEALAFGRKEAQVRVLRLGWNPSASTPSLINTLFRRREAERGSTAHRRSPDLPERGAGERLTSSCLRTAARGDADATRGARGACPRRAPE